jgi:D-sedoheptulose 7-phosphate isomerase
MNSRIATIIRNSVAVKNSMLENPVLLENVSKIVDEICTCYKNGGKVLFCGNGGSAADAQHLAAELSGRFYFDRKPLAAEALHVNTSYLTAVANDYSYDVIYSRLVEGMGKKGDVLIGLTTSGNSPNILNAFEKALELGICTVGMTGESGGKLREKSCYLLNVPSTDTPRIQESHILLGHIICELVEEKIFKG